MSSATDTSYMFINTYNFNQDISGWDTSLVNTMQGMFFASQVFDQDISPWNTGRVTSLSSMFVMSVKFNQDISCWNVSQVTDFSFMFYLSPVFNQSLCWTYDSTVNTHSMFEASSGSLKTNCTCASAPSASHCSELDCSNFGGYAAGACTDCSIASCCNYATSALFSTHCDTLSQNDYIESRCCDRTC